MALTLRSSSPRGSISRSARPGPAATLALIGPLALLAPAALTPGCSSGKREAPVTIDGSSTVEPITKALVVRYAGTGARTRIAVGVSGTGGGFKKFLLGETDINDASRAIKPSELKTAEEKGIAFIELPIAFDGISVVVHPKNTFVDHLTVAELRAIWSPESRITTWQGVRPSWPDKPLKLYGPGTDSGTFDTFTEAINGKSGACRQEFTRSEDDNILVRGVSGDADALGFFGFAYYVENQDKLRAVPIKVGDGPAVAPSFDSIASGAYTPLSRPLFLYVRADRARNKGVRGFLDFALENAGAVVKDVGYVPLPEPMMAVVRERLAKGTTGTMFKDGKSSVDLRVALGMKGS